MIEGGEIKKELVNFNCILSAEEKKYDSEKKRGGGNMIFVVIGIYCRLLEKFEEQNNTKCKEIGRNCNFIFKNYRYVNLDQRHGF